MSKSTMKQLLDESLSALVDGEVTELELRRLLSVDDEHYNDIRERWLLHQATSASIKNDVPDMAFRDLSSIIHDQIEKESLIPAPEKPSATLSLWPTAGRFAIAASVAATLVTGVQMMPNDVGTPIASTTSVPAAGVKITDRTDRPLPEDTSIRTVSNEIQPVVQQKRADIVVSESRLLLLEEEVNRLMLEHAQDTD